MKIKMKKLIVCTLIFLLSFSCLASPVSAEAQNNDTGDFIVTGGTYGTDYTYAPDTDILRILTDTKLTISTNGKPTSGMIWGQGSDIFNIVLQNVYLTGTQNDVHINILGNLNLTISGTNKIDVTGDGLNCANLTITSASTGSLVLAGTNYGLRLIGDSSGNGNLTVNGGTLIYNSAEISGTTTITGTGAIKQMAPTPSLSVSDIERTKNSLTVTGTFDTSTYGNIEYQWDGGNWSPNATLSNLSPESQHTVAIRYAGNNTYAESDASTTLSVSTMKDGSTLVSEPADLNGSYGQALSAVTLANGWNWTNPDTSLTVGTQSYPAFFDTTSYEADDYDFTGITGYDAANKRINRNLTVSVETASSTITITAANMDKDYDGNPVSNPQISATGSTKDVSITWYQKVNGVWTLLTNAPADAGSYKVVASVEADNNFNGTSTEKEFTISQADNEWMEELSIKGWRLGQYDKTGNAPTASAKFGDVTFTYSQNRERGFTTDIPQEAGTWYVKAEVTETDNYTGLKAVQEFTIYEPSATQNTNKGANAGKQEKDSGAKTGDTADIFLWGMAAVLASFGIVFAGIKRRSR